jgi:hypothetical protein
MSSRVEGHYTRLGPALPSHPLYSPQANTTEVKQAEGNVALERC